MLKVRSKMINWGKSCWGWLNRIALAICDHYFFAFSNNITCINVNMPTKKILTVVIRLIALHWPSVIMLNDSYFLHFLIILNALFVFIYYVHKKNKKKNLLFSRSKPVHLSCWHTQGFPELLGKSIYWPGIVKCPKKPYHNIPSLLKSHYSFGWRKAKFMVLFHQYLCCYSFKSCSSQLSFAQGKVLVNNNIHLSIFLFEKRIIKLKFVLLCYKDDRHFLRIN